MVSTIKSEKPIERIRTLEEKINAVEKIQNIENSVLQLKKRLWITKEVLSSSEVCDFWEFPRVTCIGLLRRNKYPTTSPMAR